MRTAKEYREEARTSRQRRAESFERCDTDGFLSQWSLDLHAQLCVRRAEILEAGGKALFTVLFEGRREVDAKLIDGKFGLVWLLSDDEEKRFGRKFVPEGKNSKVQKELGLREGNVKKLAWARIDGKGYGLSGTCWVQIFRIKNEKEREYYK